MIGSNECLELHLQLIGKIRATGLIRMLSQVIPADCDGMARDREQPSEQPIERFVDRLQRIWSCSGTSRDRASGRGTRQKHDDQE